MSRSKIGVGADGSHNAFAKAGEPTLAIHHDPNVARATDHLHGDKSIARNGAPKRMHPVSVHSGMHRTTGTNDGAPKTEMLSGIPDASSPLACDPTKPGKTFAPVKATPGMRSRTSQHDAALGKAILDSALCNK
jgi:hypothetical protein